MAYFSVIVPCYNCIKTLEPTVVSVCRSGLPEHEILLIDDGSTDGTSSLCDELAERETTVRCIHQQNAGVSAARNRGIAEAKGDYLWFVDADDTVDEGALHNAARIAAEQQPDVLFFGMRFDHYRKGKLYRQETMLPPQEGPLAAEALNARFREFYLSNALSSACNKLIKRSILLRDGLRFHEDMILLEDLLFVLELLPHCETLYCLPEAIYRYRQGEDEKGAYRRLTRISDLSVYLQPIADSIHRLSVPDADKMIAEIYRMLLCQKLSHAPLKQIRQILQIHQAGKYAEAYGETRALRIWVRYRYSHLRHRIAVFLKSRKLLRRS